MYYKKVSCILMMFLTFTMTGKLMSQETNVPNNNVSQMNPAEKTIYVWNALNKNNLKVLDDYYAKDLVFEDPLGKIEGLDAMKKYYAVMYENVTQIRFDFSKTIAQGNEYFFRWKMTLRSSKLNGGDDIVVEGGSMILFNDAGLVVYHRDFFDMGEMIYEHIPLLRTVIKSIKGRFAH